MRNNHYSRIAKSAQYSTNSGDDDFQGRNNANLGSVFTVALWIKQFAVADAVNGAQCFFEQALSVGVKKFSQLADSSGNFEGRVRRVTSVSIYTSTGGPLLVANKWYFIILTYDDGAAAGSLMHMYYGDEDTPFREVSYALQTDGAGALNAEAATGFVIGNQTTAGQSIYGNIAMLATWDRIPPRNELLIAQFKPRELQNYHMLHFPGEDGRFNSLDRSVNHLHAYFNTLTVGSLPPRSVADAPRWLRC